MAYTGKKNYRSRREKYETVKRNSKLIFIFALLAISVTIYKNRKELYDWFMITFVD